MITETTRRYAVRDSIPIVEEIAFADIPDHPNADSNGRVVIGVSNPLFSGDTLDPYSKPLLPGIVLLGTDGFDGEAEYTALVEEIAAEAATALQDGADDAVANATHLQADRAVANATHLQADRAILAAWLISQGAPEYETNHVFGVTPLS
jgi:hypothetical protein